MGRSRGGLTSKIHAVVDSNGLPVPLALTADEAHDNRLAAKLLARLNSGQCSLLIVGYDADWIRALVSEHGAWANIPPRRNRNDALCFSPYLYRTRNLIERFFNKIKQCRRVATRSTSSRPTTWRSSSSRRYAYGCASMSLRPRPVVIACPAGLPIEALCRLRVPGRQLRLHSARRGRRCIEGIKLPYIIRLNPKVAA